MDEQLKAEDRVRFVLLGKSYLVNIDSEEDWRITVGCAGAFNVDHATALQAEQNFCTKSSRGLIRNHCILVSSHLYECAILSF